MITPLSNLQPRAFSRPTRSAGSGDRFEPAGSEDAMQAAQRFLAQQRAEQARYAGLVNQMRQLPPGQLRQRGAEILRELPAEESTRRHEAATIYFQGLVNDPDSRPVASLALAVLGDPSELPQTPHRSIVEQCREQTEGPTCAGGAVELALAALEGPSPGPAQLVDLGREMVRQVPRREGSMQQGFAAVRVLANLVARFDPEQQLQSTSQVVDFLTAPLGNWDFSRQTEGGNQVLTSMAGLSLHSLGEVMQLKQLHESTGGPMGLVGQHVVVGGVRLRKRG